MNPSAMTAEDKRSRGMVRFGKRKSAYFRFGRSDPELGKSCSFRAPAHLSTFVTTKDNDESTPMNTHGNVRA